MEYYFKKEKECVNMHKTCLFSFSHEKQNEEHLLDTKGLGYENTAAVVRPEEIKPHFMHHFLFIYLSFSFLGGLGVGRLDLISKTLLQILLLLWGANLK